MECKHNCIYVQFAVQVTCFIHVCKVCTLLLIRIPWENLPPRNNSTKILKLFSLKKVVDNDFHGNIDRGKKTFSNPLDVSEPPTEEAL